jgi:molybdate transport system ATP-binding protein
VVTGACLAEAAFLDLDLDHRQGALRLKLAFQLTGSWTVLFGPSGSGKSTILRAVAGLMKPDRGRIIYAGRTLLDTSRALFVPTHRRQIRGAGQTAWLMPQRTVRDCVLAGIRQAASSVDQADFIDQLLYIFRVNELVNRDISGLSGGERQRVSVASAVAAAAAFEGPEKALLLLDEPFSGLGGALRDEIAVELKEWLKRRKIPVLSVSHDVAECFLLQAEVVRIAEGSLVAQGPVEAVLAEERERILSELKSRG